MKHVLGMVKPHQDLRASRIPKAELDYLRLVYAVSQIRRQGEDAQGYFVVTDGGTQNRLSHLERDYRGKEYVEVLGVSLNGYFKTAAHDGTTEMVSGLVRAAVLDKGEGESAVSLHRRVREFVLAATILGREPEVRQVSDETRFPFHVRWDYYGVVEGGRNV